MKNFNGKDLAKRNADTHDASGAVACDSVGKAGEVNIVEREGKVDFREDGVVCR